MAIEVNLSKSGNVATIRFSNSPFNYACPELLAKIADALEVIDSEPAIRATVLVAEGRSFCAGADLAGDPELAQGDGMAVIAQLYVQAQRIFRRRKPMVAAVHGAAIGAGLGLALAADFRVAGPRTRLSSNFVRLGFHPGFGLTFTLPRLIGAQRAAWMSLSAERVKPDHALAWGLVDKLVVDDVGDAAHAMADEIADNGPLALMAVRATLMAGLADEVAAAMRHEHAEQTKLMATRDYREGVSSVFENREARFIGA